MPSYVLPNFRIARDPLVPPSLQSSTEPLNSTAQSLTITIGQESCKSRVTSCCKQSACPYFRIRRIIIIRV